MAQTTLDKKGTISPKTVTTAAMYAKLKSTIEDQGDDYEEEPTTTPTVEPEAGPAHSEAVMSKVYNVGENCDFCGKEVKSKYEGWHDHQILDNGWCGNAHIHFTTNYESSKGEKARLEKHLDGVAFDGKTGNTRTDPWDSSTWSDTLRAKRSNFIKVNGGTEDNFSVEPDTEYATTVHGDDYNPNTPKDSEEDVSRGTSDESSPTLNAYDQSRIDSNCRFCGEPIETINGRPFGHHYTVGGWCSDAVLAKSNPHEGSGNEYEDAANRIRTRLGMTDKTDNWVPSTWSPAIIQAHSEFYKDNKNDPDFNDPANGGNFQWSTPEHVGDFLAGKPQRPEHISPSEEGNAIGEEPIAKTPQEVNTAHNVSQQMAGSVSVTPSTKPEVKMSTAGVENPMAEYWNNIAKDHTTSIRSKGAEANAARKRLSPYPLFKHFDDLVKAKKALEIPTDRLESKGQKFATISPEDSDEYVARATRHNELVKAIADVSNHFTSDIYGKKDPMPTTLDPDHDHSHLLGPVQDSEGRINLKSDLGEGPFDYGVVNEYRYGKGSFGYEMKPIDSPISPMTTAGKTSAGLGASQKRAPAKKTLTGVSKFATPDNNPSPSYKVKTNYVSFDPEHPSNSRNKSRPLSAINANKKAFLMSKMNEIHPLPTEEEKAGMSSAEHQSVVDNVFKNRTAWLKKSMESNIDHMLPSKDSNA
jgi:hypothetical protein